MATPATTIITLSGSLRKHSFNTALAKHAAEHAKSLGATAKFVDLNDYPMPLFCEDLEAQGTPREATEFKALLKGCDGIVIASPEYNGSMSAALKNAIDWASRPAEGESPLEAFDGKACALISASPGGLGGIRGLLHLRALLGNIRLHVIPQQHCVSAAHEKIDAGGKITDEKTAQAIEGVTGSLVEMSKLLRG
jgi:NAD(P)H-dependent FMN reductase